MNPADIFTNGDWMLSQSRTMSLRRDDLVVLGTVKTEAQKEHFITHNARRRCVKKNFEGIHDRFQKDLTYRDSQLRIGWTEEKCIEMDELAQKDFTCRPSPEEFERCKKNWSISLNTSGRHAPMKTPIRLQRSNNKDAPSSP